MPSLVLLCVCCQKGRYIGKFELAKLVLRNEPNTRKRTNGKTHLIYLRHAEGIPIPIPREHGGCQHTLLPDPIHTMIAATALK